MDKNNIKNEIKIDKNSKKMEICDKKYLKIPKNNDKNTEILQKKPKFNAYNAENSITYFDYILDKWVQI